MAVENIKTLRQMKSLKEIVKSDYYQREFVNKYINDIPRFAHDLFGIDLTWQQEDVVNSFSFLGGRVVVASGHCMIKGTPIMLSNGNTKEVQDLTLSDRLMGDDGSSDRTILNLCCGTDDMYKFTLLDGTERVYNKEHILCLVATQTHGRQKVGDKIEIKVSDWIKWSDRKKRTHCFYRNGVLFSEKDLTIEPYFLGVWLGDGSSAETAITNIDQEVIDYIYKYANKKGRKVSKRVYGEKTPAYSTIKGRSTLLKQELKEYKLINNKHIPKEYLKSSRKQRLELLAGIIDTDGSLDKRGKTVFEITQKNKRLSYEIYALIKSLGFSVAINETIKYCTYEGEKKNGTYYRIVFSGKVSAIPTLIKRKQGINANRDTSRVGIKNVEYLGKDEYFGFSLDGNHRYLDGDYIVSHNSTGKTKLLSIIATAFILLFPKSLVRIQAPTDMQVTKFSFKEISDNLSKLRGRRKINGKIIESKWAFLAKHIIVTKTLVYVKGFQTSWYIEPKSAPIGKSENLSGQHNEYYLLIFDEMSGIEDDHITASLGGTSDPINCAIGFSQHTRKSGKFNDFMTSQSVDNGGVWIPHILNSEESPRVGIKEIKAWRATYNDNEYAVRVKGLPPIFSEGNLLDNEQVAKIYSREGKKWIDKLKFKTRTLSADTSFTGQRDKGVISASRVANIIDAKGIAKLYIILDDIQIPKRKIKSPIKPYRYLKPFELKDEVMKQVFLFMQKDVECDRTKVAWDRNSGGDEAYYKLEEQLAENGNGEVEAYGIAWGSTDDMRKAERKKFLNQKAKCYAMLKEIIEDNRFYCACEKYRQLLTKEAENLPFEMTTDNFKFKMVGKEKLRKLNISSPDIMDTIAQMLLMYFPEESLEENKMFKQGNEIEEELSADDFEDSLELEEDELVEDESTENEVMENQLIM